MLSLHKTPDLTAQQVISNMDYLLQQPNWQRKPVPIYSNELQHKWLAEHGEL